MKQMIEGGRLLGSILELLLKEVAPGITLAQIEEKANRLIIEAGGQPSFKLVKGYHWATCICINEEVVHGIPTNYIIKDGDIVTIDIGMLYQGYHTDTASTVIAGKLRNDNHKTVSDFLASGQKALARAIKAATPGHRIWDISRSMEEVIRSGGYEPVRSLVGHGIGRELHEAPQIPCFTKGSRERTLKLETGMALAIEVIYAQGCGEVVYGNDDGWTIATRDGSLSAVFEHTIIVGEVPKVLTKRPGDII
jgi:methionyl aminopeptidase